MIYFFCFFSPLDSQSQFHFFEVRFFHALLVELLVSCPKSGPLFLQNLGFRKMCRGSRIFSVSETVITVIYRQEARERRSWGDKIPGGGGYLTKFYTGRLRPEVQPLTLSYTILAGKVPLLYTFLLKKGSRFLVVLNK